MPFLANLSNEIIEADRMERVCWRVCFAVFSLLLKKVLRSSPVSSFFVEKEKGRAYAFRDG